MPSGTPKRWDGSAFRTGGTLKRWDGSAFRTGGTMRRWNGTAFVPAVGAAPAVIVRHNTAEGGTSGTAVTATTQTGSTSGDAFTQISGSAIAFSNVQKQHGTLSYKFDQAASSVDYMSWVGISPSALSNFYTRMYVYYTAFPTASAFFQRGMDTSLNLFYKMSITGTASTPGQIRIYDSTNVLLATSTQAMALNTWYRIESHVVVGTTTGSIEVRGYVGDSTTATISVSASNLNTGPNVLDNFAIGPNVTSTTPTVATMYIDDIAVASGNWIGTS